MARQPLALSFEPLIPLPQSHKHKDSPRTEVPPAADASSPPFSMLFDPLPAMTNTRPLFPTSSDAVNKHEQQSNPASSSNQPLESEPSTPSDAFGDFVEFDPLQPSSSTFSPLPSPAHSRFVSATTPNPPESALNTDPGLEVNAVRGSHGAFDQNIFVQEAAARSRERNTKVMEELSGRDENDPLGWLTTGPPQQRGNDDEAPFDDWDGMGEDAVEEISDHARLPHTPRASRSSTPTKEPYSSDDDIIDLNTGRRERRRPPTTTTTSNPIDIMPHEPSSPKASTSSSYFNNFTLPRTWFSAVSASPPVVHKSDAVKGGLTRQTSTGEFSDLPHPDLKAFEGLNLKKQSSPRFGLAGVFEQASAVPGDVVATSPLAKKVYIPATGAPGAPGTLASHRSRSADHPSHKAFGLTRTGTQEGSRTTPIPRRIRWAGRSCSYLDDRRLPFRYCPKASQMR